MIILIVFNISNDIISFCFKNGPTALTTPAITTKVIPYIIELLKISMSTNDTTTAEANV